MRERESPRSMIGIRNIFSEFVVYNWTLLVVVFILKKIFLFLHVLNIVVFSLMVSRFGKF